MSSREFEDTEARSSPTQAFGDPRHVGLATAPSLCPGRTHLSRDPSIATASAMGGAKRLRAATLPAANAGLGSHRLPSKPSDTLPDRHALDEDAGALQKSVSQTGKIARFVKSLGNAAFHASTSTTNLSRAGLFLGRSPELRSALQSCSPCRLLRVAMRTPKPHVRRLAVKKLQCLTQMLRCNHFRFARPSPR